MEEAPSSTAGARNSGFFPSYATLPANAPEVLSRNVVEIRDLSYVEPLVELDRRRKFQDLVTRYMNQLLYGCQRKHCNTPTCWTARKMQTTKGVNGHAKTTSLAAGRKLTVLSARIIAANLATRDDPYGALCPGKPVVPVQGGGKRMRKKEPGTEGQHTQASTTTNTPGSVGESEQGGGVLFDKSAMDKGAKDPKSFTQQLYDTNALRRLEWRSLPPPANIFQLWQKESAAGGNENESPGGLSRDDGRDIDSESVASSPAAIQDTRPPSVVDVRHKDPPEVSLKSPTARKKDITAATPKSSHMKDMLIGIQTPTSTSLHHHGKIKKTPRTATPHVAPLAPPPIPHHNRHQAHPPSHIPPSQLTQTTPSRINTTSSSQMQMQEPQTKDVYVKPPQSLSHLSLELVESMLGLVQKYDQTDPGYRFVKQTIFYTLGNPNVAYKCFLDPSVPEGWVALNPNEADAAFRLLLKHFEDDVYKALWRGLGGLYRTIPEEVPPGEQPPGQPLTDPQAAQIVMLSLHALAASLPRTHGNEWGIMRIMRSRGRVTKDMDLEHELAERLMSRLVKALDYWVPRVPHSPKVENRAVVVIKEYLRKCAELDLQERREQARIELGEEFAKTVKSDEGKGWSLAYCSLEWARSMFLKSWDGGEVIPHGTVAAGCLRMMRVLYYAEGSSGIALEVFQTPAIADRIDPKETPVEWFNSSRREIHILDHPFLFPSHSLVTYFRAINLAHMTKAYEQAQATERLLNLMTHAIVGTTDRHTSRDLYERLRVALAPFLLIEVRRQTVLSDALDQIWRRELRELQRPLKVRFINQGEEGVDHGGVQQEFFSIVLREVLRPDYGLFTEDPRTHMSWFQICPLEPLYKYEMIGLLFSLAVYNGITLPVTFPRMFYRNLLGYKVEGIEHIEDGFPELARGLRELLAWEDGDVGDVFMRTYEFSYEAFGKVESVNMLKAREVGVQQLPPVVVKKSTFPNEQHGGKTTSASARSTAEVDSDPETAESEDEEEEGEHSLCTESSTTTTTTSHDPTPSTAATMATEDWEVLADTDDLPAPSSQPQAGPPSTHSHPTPAYLRPYPHLLPPETLTHVYTTYSLSSPYPSPTLEAPLVTNSNRQQYVRDYITWLSHHSVAPQLAAFRRGFLTLLPEQSLSLFTPYSLQTLIEGHQTIDTHLLSQTARYDDGYSPTHPLILEFWNLVHTYTQAQKRKLLEFVTASDRVPVGGVGSIVFVIQRNGGDSERVPTSLTCFGRLLLPEYTPGTGKLERKMRVVLENSSGFGTP